MALQIWKTEAAFDKAEVQTPISSNWHPLMYVQLAINVQEQPDVNAKYLKLVNSHLYEHLII